MWNEENLAKNEQMKEEEGYATMKIDEVCCLSTSSCGRKCIPDSDHDP